MRIGMMTDVYKPQINGVTNYIALNKRYLENLGHEVYVFTFGNPDYKDDEPRIIRSIGVPLKSSGYYFNIHYNKKARRLLRTMDIVHVHHPFLSGSLAKRYCKSWGIPIIFTNHTRYDLYVKAYIPGMPEVITNNALQAYLPSFCRSVDLVVSPSEGMKKILLQLGVDVFIDVVPNGIDLGPFRKTYQTLTRDEFGIDNDDTLFIYTGRLGPEKNIEFLLEAFAGVAKAFAKVKLMLVGTGLKDLKYKSISKNLGLDDKVIFTGFIPYNELPGYLCLADAYVTASVTEVHPLSVIEAMASGLCVLGIQSPGVGDTIEDGKTGYLAANEDIAEFTAKMVRLAVEKEKRIEMGQSAKIAAEKYAIENTVQLMLERYRTVIEKASAKKWSLTIRFNRFMDQLLK
jgi:glycosyltransferase involved in cell wall biosynthesis